MPRQHSAAIATPPRSMARLTAQLIRPTIAPRVHRASVAALAVLMVSSVSTTARPGASALFPSSSPAIRSASSASSAVARPSRPTSTTSCAPSSAYPPRTAVMGAFSLIRITCGDFAMPITAARPPLRIKDFGRNRTGRSIRMLLAGDSHRGMGFDL